MTVSCIFLLVLVILIMNTDAEIRHAAGCPCLAHKQGKDYPLLEKYGIWHETVQEDNGL